ncbi:sterol desaturase family protein [Haliea sp.]
MESEVVVSSFSTLVYTFTFGVFGVCMLWEMLAPRRAEAGGVAWRWGNNFSLGLVNWYLSAVANTLLVLWVADWTDRRELGLMQFLDWGPLPQFLILLAATQLLGYWVHVAFHRVPWLWPIHAVHHSDTQVDVSTSYRHHPLEPLLTLPISAPLVFLLGVSLEAAAAYRLFAVLATVFSHSNVQVPEGLERRLRWLVLTPDFHRVHHSSDSRYTNSNYGSLVPWFDYLFGSARHWAHDEHETRELGLEYLREPGDSRFDHLLTQPLLVPGAAGQEQHR